VERRQVRGARLGQRLDQPGEVGEGARPAVAEQHRHGVRPRRAQVREVDALAVDLGGELRELVEPPLVRPPVVAVAPVPGQLAQVVAGDAVLPPGTRQLVGPAGRVQPAVQLVQVPLRDGDPEGLDAFGHGSRVTGIAATSCPPCAAIRPAAQ
jgi:hypothetical protein